MSQKKVIVASDSTCDLGEALIQKYEIKIVPLMVYLGEKDYIDGVDVTPDDIYAHYERTGELPKTAAPTIADFEMFFKEQTALGNAVVLFTLSSTMSATYHNALLAAEGLRTCMWSILKIFPQAAACWCLRHVKWRRQARARRRFSTLVKHFEAKWTLPLWWTIWNSCIRADVAPPWRRSARICCS